MTPSATTRTLFSAFAMTLVTASCGSSNPDAFPDLDGSSGNDGAAHGDGGRGPDGSPIFGGDGGGGVVLGCSGDLQTVVDPAGHVVKTCPPDQGCLAGACIAACDAAAASKGSVGCDFLVSTPSFQQQILAPCFAVFLANNWPKPLKITVSRGGTPYDVTTFGRIPAAGMPEGSWPTVPAAGVPSGEVAVLFLSSDPNSMNGTPMKCPVADAIDASTAVAGTGRGQAFHIVTDTPVSAYDIHPYGGAKSFLPSAELLLPTSAWGTNYIASMPRNGDYENGVADGPQWAHVLAMTNNTTVKIVPTVALPGGAGVAAGPQNVVTSYTINAGEYIQWQPPWTSGSGAPMELSGSVISSDHPVMFEGGNGYLCLSSKTNAPMGAQSGGCDSGHQTIPPVSALASEYAVAPYATRRADLADESIIYRIVGAVDGTTLSYDPPVALAPTALKTGQLADFEAAGAFVVKSQDANHPFYVAQMMSGGYVTSGSRPGALNGGPGGDVLGDEEYVNVPAPAQYLQKYVFFTDPTYPTTNLVITRTKRADGTFADVNVDCIGNILGWKAMGTAGNYQTANVDLLRAGVASGTCANGGHVAKSAGAFGMVVWGLDSFSSYAYPAGGNVATINSVIVQPAPR